MDALRNPNDEMLDGKEPGLPALGSESLTESQCQSTTLTAAFMRISFNGKSRKVGIATQ